MIKIKKCIEIDEQTIYDTFSLGFSDYMIPINMTKDSFIEHFFGIEGNEKAYSFVAFDDDKAVGVVLGGIKKGEQLKTLRCGAMCVIPEHRGSYVGYELMKAHENLAIELGCKQLFLEVLMNNVKGFEFYNRFGYEKIYDLSYKKLDVKSFLDTYKNSYEGIQMKTARIEFDELYGLHGKEERHLPWQSDFPYFKQEQVHCYGLFDFGELVAGIAVSSQKIYYLYVMKDYRLKGFATALLLEGLRKTKAEKVKLSYSNNHSMHNYSKYIKMEADGIGQFELYKLLK